VHLHKSVIMFVEVQADIDLDERTDLVLVMEQR